MPIIITIGMDRGKLRPPGRIIETQVDEAGSGDFSAGHLVQRAQLLSDFFRQCARISLRALGKHHGGVRRQVAMRRIARRLYSDSLAGQIRRQYAFELESIRSEEHTCELQTIMRISYAVFGFKQKT